jgi:hypothetical protein
MLLKKTFSHKKIVKKQNRTRKYKLRGSGITLYHGSPNIITELIPKTPRSNINFQKTTAIYLTSDINIAKIYAIARDNERINKGWAVKDGKLYLRKDLWKNSKKYRLNDKGYVYIFTDINNAIQNPVETYEYKVLHSLVPSSIIEVSKDDIKDLIVYLSKEDMNKLFS